MNTNPFKAGIHAGVQTYYGTVEDRLNAVARFDRAQCEAALQVPALQKTVESAARRRLRWLDKVVTRIHFEDHHQDFLRWELDAKGKVIGCEPFQASVWLGKHVLNPGGLAVGELVHFTDPLTNEGRCVRYRIARIERFTKNPS